MHARRVLLPIVLFAAYAYVQCASRSPARDPIDEDMPQVDHTLAVADAPDSIEELQRRIAAVLKAEKAPGAAIGLVGRDGPIWIGGIGVSNVETGAPMQADTVFRVGSLTKSIIALGVMRLVDQGKLDIDAPLREILPGLVDNPWESVAPVTLAQCMEHTAGLDDIRFNEVFTDDEWLPVRDALALNPRSRKIRWRPGTRHAYSNVGFTIAARAIEVASGEPFDVYLRREVLAPMGITDADFGRTPSITPHLATGYQSGKPQRFQIFAHRPSGSFLTSAQDLTKFVHFWIRRGEGYPPIVSAAGLDRIERSGTLPYPLTDSQYGFANYVDVQHPTMSHGHDGGMPGFHASYRYFSDLGIGYVMLLNSNYTFRGYVEVRSLIYSYLTRNRTAPPTTSRPASTERPGARFFALASPRSEIFTSIDTIIDGWLFTETPAGLHARTLDGWAAELQPMPDGGYRFPKDCGSSIRFTTNIDGTPVMVMSFMYAEAAPYWLARARYIAFGLAMLLMRFAPYWAIAVLVFDALVRRRSLSRWLVIPPALAGITCAALPHLLEAAFDAGVIGVVSPLTITVCAFTILFALSSITTLVASIRWALHPNRPRAISLVIPMLCGIAFTGLTVLLWTHGWIGMRTWDY